MPTTTGFEFGDLALVPFPFTDQRTTKRRPAVVVSSSAYHRERPDLIILAITSQVRAVPTVGEVAIEKWKEAGLLPSHQATGRTWHTDRLADVNRDAATLRTQTTICRSPCDIQNDSYLSQSSNTLS